MGKNAWMRVVQRGILVRGDRTEQEALLLENPNGTWELPGGKVDHGETARESLEREIHEETGLEVTAAEPVGTSVRKFSPKKNRGTFGVVYECRFEGRDVAVSDEHLGFAWMDRERVERANLALVDEYRSLRRVLDGPDTEERDVDSPATGTGTESEVGR